MTIASKLEKIENSIKSAFHRHPLSSLFCITGGKDGGEFHVVLRLGTHEFKLSSYPELKDAERLQGALIAGADQRINAHIEGLSDEEAKKDELRQRLAVSPESGTVTTEVPQGLTTSDPGKAYNDGYEDGFTAGSQEHQRKTEQEREQYVAQAQSDKNDALRAQATVAEGRKNDAVEQATKKADTDGYQRGFNEGRAAAIAEAQQSNAASGTVKVDGPVPTLEEKMGTAFAAGEAVTQAAQGEGAIQASTSGPESVEEAKAAQATDAGDPA